MKTEIKQELIGDLLVETNPDFYDTITVYQGNRQVRIERENIFKFICTLLPAGEVKTAQEIYVEFFHLDPQSELTNMDVDFIKCMEKFQNQSSAPFLEKFTLLKESNSIVTSDNTIPVQPVFPFKESELIKKIFISDKFIQNVCLSYRHDFGLIAEQDKQRLIFECKEWLRAISNNIDYAILHTK